MASQHKRSRLIERVASLGLKIPAKALLHFRCSGDDGDDDGIPTHSVAEAVTRYSSSIESPIGTVIQRMQLKMKDGSFFDCPFIHPCAILWFLCSISTGYGHLIAEYCSSGTLDLVIWADEAVSGNSLRPDLNRKFLSVYFSVLQWPDYVRASDWGWIPITVLSANFVKLVSAELSGVLRKILHVFFTEGGANFTTGFEATLGSSGPRISARPPPFRVRVIARPVPCPLVPTLPGD